MDWNALWAALAAWDAQFRLLTIAGIVLGAVALRWILLLIIRRIVRRIVNGAKRKQGAEDTQALLTSPLAAVRIVQRTTTLGAVLGNGITAVIVVVAVVVLFAVLLPEATSAFALITAALGAGLGFGAQNLVKDVLNGLFMVSEDQLGIGDVVDTGFATGVVEGVGIRITQVRDVNGTLWFVRNGEILRVGQHVAGLGARDHRPRGAIRRGCRDGAAAHSRGGARPGREHEVEVAHPRDDPRSGASSRSRRRPW